MAEPSPDEVRDLAEACIRFVREALGLELDYTPETLPVLDHYLKERAVKAQPEVQELIAPAAGATGTAAAARAQSSAPKRTLRVSRSRPVRRRRGS